MASGVLALVVTGCGDETSDDGSAASSLVSVAAVDGTDVLVDADGHTLYSADVEHDGQILCVDACTSFWKPVTASADDVREASTQLHLELGVVERPNGDSQLTYEDLPLYTFVEEDAGELEGDGFADDFQGTHFEWSAARTDGSSSPPGGGFAY